MSQSVNEKFRGVATLFDNFELKDFFKNYLILMGIVEVFIFFVSFVSQLGPDNVPFPWKSYAFASFIIPIAITFLLGVFVIAFNKYLFIKDPLPHDISLYPMGDNEQKRYINKLHLFLHSIRQVPFLLSLLILVICSIVFYKLDAILLFIGHAGEEAARYILISAGVLLAVATVFGLIWIIMNYSLCKKKMDYQFRYKKEVMDRLGLVVLDDNRVIDKQGNVIAPENTKGLELTTNMNDDNLPLLPSLPKNLSKE